MDGFYGNNNSKLTWNSSVSSVDPQNDHQLIISRPRYGFTNPVFDSQTPDSFDIEPTLIRYPRTLPAAAIVPYSGDLIPSPAINSRKIHTRLLQHYHNSNFSSRSTSSSPLSRIDNLETPPSRSPPVFKTPGKVEEDVLVMDGIPVWLLPGGRSRSASDSGSSSSPGNSLYRREICRTWEDSGSCRYGSKCQFAHGKEELRPTRNSNKNKSEICKSYTTGTCAYGAKCRFAHQDVPAVAASAGTTSMIKPEQESNITSVDWSPEDDGIEIGTEGSPAREDVDAYIREVLYGPLRRRRLPVFAELCSE